MMAILPWLKEQQRMSWQHHFILRHKQKANKEIHVYVCTCQAAAAQAAGWWCTFPFPHLFRGNQSVHKIHAATWYALYTQRSTICQMVFLFFSVICWTTTQLGSLSCTIFEYPFYRWNWVIRRRKGEMEGTLHQQATPKFFQLVVNHAKFNKYPPPTSARRPEGRSDLRSTRSLFHKPYTKSNLL